MPNEALAERRVALVVGNSNYSAVPTLPNPSRDANAVAKMFKDAGFQTIETYLDVGNLDFKRAIRKFEDTAVEADIAVLYYAGHGIEIGGTNYLIPIDAKLASDRDAPDEAIPLDRLVLSADGAKKLRVIILDACRDNPLRRQDAPRKPRGAARGIIRPRQGRTVEHRHADRLCGEGRLHRRRRRSRPQPLHGRAAEASHRAGARPASGFRPRQGRGDEVHQRPPGAVRVRFARRRQLLARRRSRRGEGRDHMPLQPT